MRKNKRWFKLNMVLPSMLVLPPLGFYLLWASPRSRALKIGLSVFVVLVFLGTGLAVWKTEYYRTFLPPEIPASGYEVHRDERGRYRIKEILPFERQIFDEVVREMRRFQKIEGSQFADTEARAMEDPESKAVAIVGERHGIDSSDISAIFLKVSSAMSPQH